MAITRVTQQMLSDRSLNAVMGGLGRMSKFQEQLETGKKINRPSDDAAGTNTALRIRNSLAEQTQYGRNAQDGQAWLSTIDSTLKGIVNQMQRANVLALQAPTTVPCRSRRPTPGHRGRPDPCQRPPAGEHAVPRTSRLRRYDDGRCCLRHQHR